MSRIEKRRNRLRLQCRLNVVYGLSLGHARTSSFGSPFFGLRQVLALFPANCPARQPERNDYQTDREAHGSSPSYAATVARIFLYVQDAKDSRFQSLFPESSRGTDSLSSAPDA